MPVPRPSATMRATGTVSGRGIACVAYEGDNGYAALVAEVEVDQASGRVQAKRFVVAHDCGPISNPDGLRNQIEGGVLQGTSRALGEEITWDDRKVTSIDWRSYNTLPLGIAAAGHRERSPRPPSSESDWSGRDGDHIGRCSDRQRDFRCHRRTDPASAFHARARESGDVRSSQENLKQVIGGSVDA